MRALLVAGLMTVGLVWSGTSGLTQAATSGAAGVVAQVSGATAKASSSATDTRNDKQKALAAQTERLFTMATDLKAQVDLTNRNILSVTVVRKAEEIEALARQMKGQAKK